MPQVLQRGIGRAAVQIVGVIEIQSVGHRSAYRNIEMIFGLGRSAARHEQGTSRRHTAEDVKESQQG